MSGNPVFTTREMPISLVGGLPTVIPGILRTAIRLKDPLITRGVLSLFAVYRIIKVPCKLKLESITDPFKGISEILPWYELNQALRSLNIRAGVQRLTLKDSLVLATTAGPNYATSMLGIHLDLEA